MKVKNDGVPIAIKKDSNAKTRHTGLRNKTNYHPKKKKKYANEYSKV